MADPPASADENPENIAQENNPPGKEDDEAGKVAAGAETSEAEAEEKASVNEQEFTEDQKASVRRQVDFYFCDANLVRDAFLKNTISEDADGFVDIKLLMTFQRMRTIFNIGKEVKADEMSADLAQSIGQELRDLPELVVNEDNTRVRRKTPLGSEEEVRKKITERSVHVSNLDKQATLEELETFFAKHVDLHCVWMIRHGKKGFQGSVFLDCKDAETANEFLEKDLEYDGRALKIVRKSEVVGKEAEERKARGKGDGNDKKRGREGRGRGRGNRGGRGRGGGGRGRRSMRIAEAAGNKGNDGDAKNQTVEVKMAESTEGGGKRKAKTSAADQDAPAKKSKGNTDEGN